LTPGQAFLYSRGMEKTRFQSSYLEDIVDAGAAVIRAEFHLWAMVTRARNEGRCTWEDVGHSLGVTRQAAYERFSKPPRGRMF
jgi:hypothetical protein